ncbi:hypothetical protein [Streptomyces sp. NPDC048825]|uniref:hypothetical protein n=1 Tax=Streptomyces sp. NPDC048825 TaxID=3365592 RepID=UPI00371323BD
MAWLTRIIADAQVEYRLRQQAGCAVVESSAEETVVIDDGEDAAVDYRLRPEGGAPLVWMGSGLRAVGLADGQALDEAVLGARWGRVLADLRDPCDSWWRPE